VSAGPDIRAHQGRTLAPFALAVLALIALAALLGPWLVPFGPEQPDWANASVAPGLSHGHWLGTDAIGRDVLVRTLSAGRVSLAVGLVAAVAALAIGLLYGAVAGYIGGRTERMMIAALDVFAALPFLLIVVLLLTLFGRSLPLLLAAIAGAVWTDLARVARAEAARLRREPFILAAVAMGASPARIIVTHIVPQLLPLGAVYLGLLVPHAILVESFLGFLGLSVDEPSTGWGGLLAEGVHEMLDAPWVLLAPAVMLVMTLLAATLLSDALRDRVDARRILR
jgi:oligopeptide transport system permease protein